MGMHETLSEIRSGSTIELSEFPEHSNRPRDKSLPIRYAFWSQRRYRSSESIMVRIDTPNSVAFCRL